MAMRYQIRFDGNVERWWERWMIRKRKVKVKDAFELR
jgi:hypothetical protein